MYHIFVLEAGGGSSGGSSDSSSGGSSSEAAVAGSEGPVVSKLWLLRQLTEEDKDEVPPGFCICAGRRGCVLRSRLLDGCTEALWRRYSFATYQRSPNRSPNPYPHTQLLHDPVHCYAAPFPKELLALSASEDRDRVAAKLARTMRRWWESWSSHDAAAAAAQQSAGTASAAAGASAASVSSFDGPVGGSTAAAGGSRAAAAARRAADAAVEAAAMRMMDADFRLFDAYGLWRSMQAAPREAAGGRARGGRRGMGRDAALFYMQRCASPSRCFL